MASTLEAAALMPDISMPQEEVYDIASLGEGLKMKHRGAFELNSKNAADFLDYPEFIIDDVKVDRNRSDNHVIYLARQMLAGTFLWEQVNLVLCNLPGQKPVRLNGQHTAWARLVAEDEGLDPKTRCQVQLLKYEAATIEDMRRLYASIDRGRPRSQGVVINSYIAGSEDFRDVPKDIIRRMAQGIAIWQWESVFSRNQHTGDDRAYLLLKDHHKVSLAVAHFLMGCSAKEMRHLKRAPVIGAMFATFSKAPHIAAEFWRDVRDGLQLNGKDDPRYVLRNWLMLASLSKSKYDGNVKTVLSEEMYRACIYKWNDFRADKPSRGVRIDLAVERPEPK